MWANIVKNEETAQEVVQEAAQEAEPVESSETDCVSEDDMYDSRSISTVETEYDDEYESLKMFRVPRTFPTAAASQLEPETFGWELTSIEDTIKRFRLKKLKSANHGVYYYDAVYHYIWEHSEGALKCPTASIAAALRISNEIGEEPFLAQPSMFW